MTDGTILWAGDRRFTDTSTAIPPPLQGVFDEVPKYTDLRMYRGRTDLSLDHPDFKRDVADMAAPIHGKREGQLILDADAKQFRIARVLRWSAVMALAALTVAALGASAIAVSKGREAVEQRDVAEERRTFAEGETKRAVAAEEEALEAEAVAVAAEAEAVANAAESRSRELAAQALSLRSTDPELAALVAVESLYPNGAVEQLRSPSAVNAVGVTARSLLTRSLVRSGGLVDSTRQEVIASVGGYVATVGPDDDGACWPEFETGIGVPTTILWWDRATGVRLDAAPTDVELPAFVNTEWGVLRIDSVDRATPYVGLDGCDSLPVSGEDALSFSSSPTLDPTVGGAGGSVPLTGPAEYDPVTGLLFAFDQPNGRFVTIDPVDGGEVARFDTPIVETGWRDVAVVDGIGDRLVGITTFDDRLFVVNLSTGGPLAAVEGFTGGELASVGNRVFSGANVADIALEAGTGLTETFLSGVVAADVSDAQFSDDGRFLALSDSVCQCRTTVWDVGTQQAIEIGSISSTAVGSTRWTGEELALTTARGVEFYSYRQPPAVRGSLSPLVSDDGSTVVTTVYGSTYGDPNQVVIQRSTDLGADAGGLDLSAGSYAQAVSADGGLVALGGPMRVIDTVTGEVVFTDDDPDSIARFPPAGGYMSVFRSEGAATCFPSCASSNDIGGDFTETLRIIDTTTWDEVAVAEFDGGQASYPTWTSAAELKRTFFSGGVQRLLVADDVIEVMEVDAEAAALWTSPDGRLGAVADSTGFLRLRSMTGSDAGTTLSSFDASTAQITEVAFSPDNERLITASARGVALWNVSDPTEPQLVESLDSLPLVASILGQYSSVAGVWYRDEGAGIVLVTYNSAVDLPDFDPARVCAEAGDDDLDRAAVFLGEPSACRRIPELQT